MGSAGSVTRDIAWGADGELIQPLCELQGWMPMLGACEWLETLALTTDGSLKRVRDTGELQKCS